MEKHEVILLLVGVSLFFLVLLWFWNRQINKNRQKRISEALSSFCPESSWKWYDKGHAFQLEIETDSNIFYVKVIPFNYRYELIITNPTFWCVNQSPQNWRRSSTPDLVSGVKEFLQFQSDSNKEIFKIALIYPGCHNITRYLNESDVEIVRYDKAVHGIFFVRFDELAAFFAKRRK